MSEEPEKQKKYQKRKSEYGTSDCKMFNIETITMKMPAISR